MCGDDGSTGVLVIGSRARVLVVSLVVVGQSSVVRAGKYRFVMQANLNLVA